MTLQWIGPSGNELWNSGGQIEITPPPPTVTEMDFPLIAPVDLPIEDAGSYVMRISLDNEQRADVRLQVRLGGQAPIIPAANGLVS